MRASRSWKPASDAPGSRRHHPSTLHNRVTVQQEDAPSGVQPPERFTRPEGVWVDPPAWMRATALARIAPSFLVIGAQRSGSTALYRYLAAHPRILPPLRKEVHYFDFQSAKGRAWYLAQAAEPERWSGAERLMKQAPHYYSYQHHHFSYLDRGRYAHYLEPWFELFSKEQLLVLATEALFETPDPVMNRVFEFLGLPPHRIPVGSRRKSAYASMQPELRERLQGYFSRDQKRLERLLQ